MFIVFTGFIQGVCTRAGDLGNISEFCLPKLPKGKGLWKGEDLGPKGRRPGWVSRRWRQKGHKQDMSPSSLYPLLHPPEKEQRTGGSSVLLQGIDSLEEG